MTGPPAALKGSAHHPYLIRRDVCTAGVAHLSAAWRFLNSHHFAVRQKTALNPAPDNEANNVQIHQV
jgi:hypothetical protein